jgi:hypothetical protein
MRAGISEQGMGVPCVMFFSAKTDGLGRGLMSRGSSTAAWRRRIKARRPDKPIAHINFTLPVAGEARA